MSYLSLLVFSYYFFSVAFALLVERICAKYAQNCISLFFPFLFENINFFCSALRLQMRNSFLRIQKTGYSIRTVLIIGYQSSNLRINASRENIPLCPLLIPVHIDNDIEVRPFLSEIHSCLDFLTSLTLAPARKKRSQDLYLPRTICY